MARRFQLPRKSKAIQELFAQRDAAAPGSAEHEEAVKRIMEALFPRPLEEILEEFQSTKDEQRAAELKQIIIARLCPEQP